MEAIVLAGGAGTRLRRLVPDLPKPMAPVAGRPFLEYLLGFLARKGFRRAILSLGWGAEKVTDHFGDSYRGLQLLFEIERHPLGTGGALRSSLSRCREDHVFVFNGDTYLDLEVSQVESQWQGRRLPILVGRAVPDTERYGRLLLEAGRVVGIREKGARGPGVINAGCYLFPVNVLEELPAGASFSLEKDFLARALPGRPFDSFISQGYFIDIGEPEDYARAQIEMKQVEP